MVLWNLRIKSCACEATVLKKLGQSSWLFRALLRFGPKQEAGVIASLKDGFSCSEFPQFLVFLINLNLIMLQTYIAISHQSVVVHCGVRKKSVDSTLEHFWYTREVKEGGNHWEKMSIEPCLTAHSQILKSTLGISGTEWFHSWGAQGVQYYSLLVEILLQSHITGLQMINWHEFGVWGGVRRKSFFLT